MGTGDVEVQIIDAPFTEASIDTVITAMRVTAGANGHYLITAVDNQVIVVAITEA